MVVVFVRDFRFVRASQLTLDAKKDGPTSSARRDTTRVRRRRCAFAAVGARWQGVVPCPPVSSGVGFAFAVVGGGGGERDRQGRQGEGEGTYTVTVGITLPLHGRGKGKGKKGEGEGGCVRGLLYIELLLSPVITTAPTRPGTGNCRTGKGEGLRATSRVILTAFPATAPLLPPAVVRIIRGRQSGHLQAGRSTLF